MFSRRGGANFQILLLRGGQRNCAKFGENRVPSSLHQIGYFGTDALLQLEIRAAQRRVVSKSRANSTLFYPLPSVKIRGGVGENAEWEDRIDPTAEPVEHM